MFQYEFKLSIFTHLLAIFLFIGASPHRAHGESVSVTEQDEAYGCMLRIDGVIYTADPCNLNERDGNALRFGHYDEGSTEGYWVYLVELAQGGYDAFWNEEYGAPDSSTDLGVLRRTDFGSAECFSRDKTVLCRNIQQDVPVYYIDYRGANARNNVLMAYVNGVEYELPHPNWEGVYPFLIDASADLDGDGRLETLVRVGGGGNCCPADVSIVSYRGNGFFTYIDKSPIPGGWGGLEIVHEQGQNLIRVFDVPIGVGSTEWRRKQRDYVIKEGVPVEIVERIEVAVPSALVGFTQENIRNLESHEASIDFDIDNDGVLDELHCKYWERWGLLNCEVDLSRLAKPVELQCRQVSISPIVFGPNQSYSIVCDGQRVEY